MRSPSRDPGIVLAEIDQAGSKILRFTASLTREEAFADAMRLDAILFNLQVVGEAVKALPEEIRSRRTDIAWREIAGMRDVIAHAYFALDLEIVWDAIQNDVPVLIDAVRELKERP